MRFLLGVLVGYSMRGSEKRLITVLATIAFIFYIVAGNRTLGTQHRRGPQKPVKTSSNQSSGD
jgi:hypothetical protein